MLGGKGRRGPTETGEFAAVIQGAWWLSVLSALFGDCKVAGDISNEMKRRETPRHWKKGWFGF